MKSIFNCYFSSVFDDVAQAELLYAPGQKLMFYLQYARLKAFGRIAVPDLNRALGDYRAAVGYFVDEVHGAARYLCAVV